METSFGFRPNNIICYFKKYVNYFIWNYQLLMSKPLENKDKKMWATYCPHLRYWEISSVKFNDKNIVYLSSFLRKKIKYIKKNSH